MSMTQVRSITQELQEKYSASNRRSIIFESRKDGRVYLSVLMPWKHNGIKRQVAMIHIISQGGIASSISLDNKEENEDVYSGSSADQAYTSTIQWLWRKFGAENTRL